jgi:uncharacterized SAM-binding protein YcdF (DUF218 family)
VAAIVAVLVVALCVLTAVLFVYPDLNAPERSDAIVVLGGHGAPALDRGVELAREGLAPDLVLSLQTWMHCAQYKSYLAPRLPHTHLMCFTANPQTTQGEARSIKRLARQLDWKRILVVVPTTQASRARLLIGRCYPGQVLEVGFPPEGIGEWLSQFAIQWGAMAKALVLKPTC